MKRIQELLASALMPAVFGAALGSAVIYIEAAKRWGYRGWSPEVSAATLVKLFTQHCKMLGVDPAGGVACPLLRVRLHEGSLRSLRYACRAGQMVIAEVGSATEGAWGSHDFATYCPTCATERMKHASKQASLFDSKVES